MARWEEELELSVRHYYMLCLIVGVWGLEAEMTVSHNDRGLPFSSPCTHNDDETWQWRWKLWVIHTRFHKSAKLVIFNLKFIIMYWTYQNRVYSQLRLSYMVLAVILQYEIFLLSFFCVINIQFFPGIAAVISGRSGDSDGNHTALQKVLVLRHKHALSITLLRKSLRLCCKSLSF